MHSRSTAQLISGLALFFVAIPVAIGARAMPGLEMMDEALDQFLGLPIQAQILETAKRLFWALATVSLVWTMGMLIVRQDIGEMLMELVRYVVVTGIFYWLLINAGGRVGGGGFVDDIVKSFFQMSNGYPSDVSIRTNAGGLLARGTHVFYTSMAASDGAEVGDRLLSGGIAILILIACTLMAAQFLVALVMAWMLSYAGIFLLGFGGARWTSSIAISFYKHVIAIGVALLALSIIGAAATHFIDAYEYGSLSERASSPIQFHHLGGLLAAVLLMMVLSIKIPQLMYTLVTGSPLGVFMGTATMAGHAIANGSSAAWAAASALPQGGWGGMSRGDNASARTDSVMDAVQRSASTVGAMNDPFHVSSGADPFGAARSADPHRQPRDRSAFGEPSSLAISMRPTIDVGAMGLSSPGKTVHFEASKSDLSVARVYPNDGIKGKESAGAPQTERTDYEYEIAEIEASRLDAQSAPYVDVSTSDVVPRYMDLGKGALNSTAAGHTETMKLQSDAFDFAPPTEESAVTENAGGSVDAPDNLHHAASPDSLRTPASDVHGVAADLKTPMHPEGHDGSAAESQTAVAIQQMDDFKAGSSVNVPFPSEASVLPKEISIEGTSTDSPPLSYHDVARADAVRDTMVNPANAHALTGDINQGSSAGTRGDAARTLSGSDETLRAAQEPTAAIVLAPTLGVAEGTGAMSDGHPESLPLVSDIAALVHPARPGEGSPGVPQDNMSEVRHSDPFAATDTVGRDTASTDTESTPPVAGLGTAAALDLHAPEAPSTISSSATESPRMDERHSERLTKVTDPDLTARDDSSPSSGSDHGDAVVQPGRDTARATEAILPISNTDLRQVGDHQGLPPVAGLGNVAAPDLHVPAAPSTISSGARESLRTDEKPSERLTKVTDPDSTARDDSSSSSGTDRGDTVVQPGVDTARAAEGILPVSNADLREVRDIEVQPSSNIAPPPEEAG